MVKANIQDKLTTDHSSDGRGLQESHQQSEHRPLSSASSASAPTLDRRTTSVGSWGFEPIRRMREEFDRMFDQILGNWPVLAEMGNRPLRWGCELQEDDTSVIIRAEAPGFEPSDFDVRLRGNQLILTASRRREGQQSQTGRQEWQDRDFYRSMTLPEGTDHAHVEANYRNGVLTIQLGKTEQAKSRRIPVHG